MRPQPAHDATDPHDPDGAADRSPTPPRRRRGQALAVAGVLAALVGGAVLGRATADTGTDATERPATAPPSPEAVDAIVAALGDRPVDPAEVQLVASVSSFPDCDALIGDLREVGAAHVGSRGFGAFAGGPVELQAARTADEDLAPMAAASGADGVTLGTNVQVTGVDELDHVKAEGHLVYDLDGRGNLRITDADALEVLATVDVTPGPDDADRIPAQVSDLLVADGRVAVIGSEVEVSEPVEGDPSATRSSIPYLTVTFVDATDPTAPTVTDRVQIEGSLVAARLVGGEVRLVTTSHLADLGFVLPTTPASVATALDQNRRIVAGSTAADWIPDWRRDGEEPQALVPCERVYVPDTFAGVAMTSMVTFPIGTGTFDPAGTSIVAPGTTIYAGLDVVAVSAEVWVDPAERERIELDDWQTAIHELRFSEGAPPAYEGSGIVAGSTVGQLAFGEIGESLAVVTTEGTPWGQQPEARIDLTVLTPYGDGGLATTAEVADLADGTGAVTAVRFVEGRVLVSSGFLGRRVSVIDVTDPAAPRQAGTLTVPGDVGYFHPLPDGRALVVGSRHDEVGTGRDRQSRSWVQAHLLDVADPDAPALVSTWERPWATDDLAHDHHAFTFWPDRGLALWGVREARYDPGDPLPNHAVVLSVGDAVTEVAVPEASLAPEVPAPCPVLDVTDPEAERALGPDGIALACDRETTTIDWPRYGCYRLDDATVARYAPGRETEAAVFVCSPAPPPTVSRVLVVAGTPYLLTDQTLERLDPETFGSTAVAYHPADAVGPFGR